MFLQLPPLSEYEQSLVGHWMQVGQVQQTSSGLISLEWPQIIAWADRFHRESHVEMIEHPRHSKRHKRTYTPVLVEKCTLLDWELEQIKMLSNEFVAEYSQASNPSRQCPTPIFIEDVSAEDALENAKKMKQGFSMFNTIKSKK